MKKPILIVALLLSASVLKAQKTVVLKAQYLPNHIYKSTMKIGMDMKMPGESADKPTAIVSSVTAAFEMNTGKGKPDGSFALSMKYTDATIKMSVNGAENPMPGNPMIGKIIYGQCDKDGKLHIDSIPGKDVTEQMKTGVLQMVNQIQEQMKFPDKPMQIGETITQDVPMNIPGAAGNMQMKAKATYKLVDVKGDLAYFDMTQELKLDIAEKEKTNNVTGKGGGKMVYSISQKYPTAMLTTIDMALNIPGAGNMAMKMSFDSQTAVSGK